MIKIFQWITIISAIIFLLAIIILVIFYSFQPSHEPSQQQTSTKTPDSEQQTIECETFGQRVIRDPVALFTLLLVVANFFLAASAVIQLNFFKQTTDATIEATKVARESLTKTNRPWLKVGIEIVDPLKFINIDKKTLIRTSVRITIKNIGRSVATNVRSDYQVIIAPVFGPNYNYDEFDLQKNFSEKLTTEKRHLPFDDSDCILPDDERVSSRILDYFIKEKDFLKFPKLNPFREVSSDYICPLLIVGCVDYQFDTSPDHHQTRFIYRIIQTTPIPEGTKVATINDARAFKVEVGGAIPVNELKLISHWTGQKAN
jgi:hypothetical protein